MKRSSLIAYLLMWVVIAICLVTFGTMAVTNPLRTDFGAPGIVQLCALTFISVVAGTPVSFLLWIFISGPFDLVIDWKKFFPPVVGMIVAGMYAWVAFEPLRSPNYTITYAFDNEVVSQRATENLYPWQYRKLQDVRVHYIRSGWRSVQVETVATTADDVKVYAIATYYVKLKNDNSVFDRIAKAALARNDPAEEVLAQEFQRIGVESLRAAIARMPLADLGENKLIAEWKLGSSIQSNVLRSDDYEFGNTVTVNDIKVWFGDNA